MPGYTFKGIYKELQKHLGSSVQNYIIAARTAQGYDDWKISTQSQRLDVVSRWHVAQVDLGERRRSQHRQSRPAHGLPKAKGARKTAQQDQEQVNQGSSSGQRFTAASSNTNPSAHCHSVETPSAELEKAIRQSVEVTSRGDPVEDQLIERAIRASVAELRLASEEANDDDAFKRAVQASVVEASRTRVQRPGGAGSDRRTEEGHWDNVEESAYSGMRFQRSPSGGSDQNPSHHSSPAWDDSSVDTDDDSNMKAALKESRQLGVPTFPDIDADLLQALEESRLHHHGVEKEKSEEEIVIEYVKRQSLAEHQHKQKLTAKGAESYLKDTEHNTISDEL